MERRHVWPLWFLKDFLSNKVGKLIFFSLLFSAAHQVEMEVQEWRNEQLKWRNALTHL